MLGIIKSSLFLIVKVESLPWGTEQRNQCSTIGGNCFKDEELMCIQFENYSHFRFTLAQTVFIRSTDGMIFLPVRHFRSVSDTFFSVLNALCSQKVFWTLE